MKHAWPTESKIEQKFGTNNRPFQPLGHGPVTNGGLSSNFRSQFNDTQRTMKNGMTAVGIIFFLVALSLTVVSVVLAVNVSGWFFIATLIVGGYTLIAGIMVFLQRKMLNMVERDW